MLIFIEKEYKIFYVRGFVMEILELLKNFIFEHDHHFWLISCCFFSFIFAYIDCTTFITIFNIEVKRDKFFGAVLVSGINRLLFIIISPVSWFRAINIVSSIIIFNAFFKARIEKCILGEVLNSVIIIVAEAIFAKFFTVLFDDIDSYIEGIYIFKYNASLMFSILIVRLIVYEIIKRKKVFIELSDNLEKKNKQRIIWISILVCLVVYFNTLEMTHYISDFPYSIFVFDVLSLILYFIISINSVVRISTLEKKQKEIENLELYNKTLSIMYDNIRSFKHDFFNFVQALNGYIKIKDIVGIKQMSDSILKDCSNVRQLEIFDPKLFNNPAVYSVVTSKYYLAKNENVEFNVNIESVPEGFEKYNYEFCRVLCIFLDNAIEAAMECEEKVVDLTFKKVDNKFLAIVENTYLDFDYEIDILFEKGFTTKRKKVADHGLGLWNVSVILNRNKNFSLETIKDEKFVQKFSILV